MDISFRPRAGRFGLNPVVTSQKLAANPVTASSTQTHRIPSPPGNRYYPVRATLHCDTVGVSAGGTILAYLIRRRASDDADVTLTAALDAEALTTKEKTAFVFDTAITDAQRLFLLADTLELDFVSNAAVGTQPTDVVVEVEWATLE
jgi:hypothetical protein